MITVAYKYCITITITELVWIWSLNQNLLRFILQLQKVEFHENPDESDSFLFSLLSDSLNSYLVS